MSDPIYEILDHLRKEVQSLRVENDRLRRSRNDEIAAAGDLRKEIERLRAENAKLKSTDMAVAMTEMSLRDEIVRLRARVEVLERALHGIAEFCHTGEKCTFIAIENTARAALEAKP